MSSSHLISHSLEELDVKHGDHLRVSRWGSFYFHHGIACKYGELKKVEAECNIHILRERKGREPLTELNDDTILMIEHNLDGIGVVTLQEFREWGFSRTKKNFSSTLRLVKYGMGALEMTIKMSGCGFMQPALDPDIIVKRAIAELIHEEEEKRWEYNLVARNCENFALYCTGIVPTWQGGWVEQLQITKAIQTGTLVVDKALILGLGPVIRRTVQRLYGMISSLSDPAGSVVDVIMLTKRITSILREVVASGIGSAIEFGIELIVATVRFLIPKRFTTLSITFAEWARCVFKAFVTNAGAFAGSLLGLLAGAPGGPLSILTAIIGGFIGGMICRFSVRFVMNLIDKRKFDKEGQRAIEIPVITESSITIEEITEDEDKDGANVRLLKEGESDGVLELATVKAFENSKRCSICNARVFRGTSQHHCRQCFKTMCGTCSMFLVPTSISITPQRTCRNCFEELNQDGLFAVTALTSDTLSNLASCVDASRVISIGLKNYTSFEFSEPAYWLYSGWADLPLPLTISADQALSWQPRKIPNSVCGTVGVFAYYVKELNQSIVVWWSVPHDYNLYDNEWACAAFDGQVTVNKQLYYNQPTMFKAGHGVVSCEVGKFSIRGGMEESAKAVLAIDVRQN